MKRCIITGGSGFVGANLVRRLLEDGHEVHLLVRAHYNAWRLQTILTDIHIHEVDLLDKEKLSRLVQTIQPDWIFHLAAHGAYSSQTDLEQMVETNILGTINLVQTCLNTGFETFVNTGSSSEYGYKDHAPLETDLLEPNSHYALTKATATMFCRYTSQSKNIPISTLRLYSVYGPFEEPFRLMPTVILRGLKSELPPLVKPDIARDYVYVDDVISAYLLTATNTHQELGSIYNVGTGRQTSLLEVVETAKRVMNIKAEPQWGSMDNRSWDTNVWVSNNLQIQKQLGWRPKFNFEQGFQQMIDWFRKNKDMQTFYQTALKVLS